MAKLIIGVESDSGEFHPHFSLGKDGGVIEAGVTSEEDYDKVQKIALLDKGVLVKLLDKIMNTPYEEVLDNSDPEEDE